MRLATRTAFADAFIARATTSEVLHVIASEYRTYPQTAVQLLEAAVGWAPVRRAGLGRARQVGGEPVVAPVVVAVEGVREGKQRGG